VLICFCFFRDQKLPNVAGYTARVPNSRHTPHTFHKITHKTSSLTRRLTSIPSTNQSIMSAINADGTLKKFPTPIPETEAAIAAATGDIATLNLPHVKSTLMQKDTFGNMPLHWACDRGQVDALEFLLSQIPQEVLDKADQEQENNTLSRRQQQNNSIIINTRGYLGNTPLARACRGGHLLCVELLLKRNDVDPNICNDKMQYPLHFAAFKKHPDVVRVMLESGKCDTMVTDRKGRTPAEDTSLEEIRNMILQYRRKVVVHLV
jgi:ankyrin repeat protein